MIRKKIYTCIGCLLLICFMFVWGLSGYVRYVSLSQGNIQETFAHLGDIDAGFFETSSGRKLHYVQVGDRDGVPLLLIHGAPGSIMDRKKTLNDKRLSRGWNIVLVDRLGYGKSGMGSVERSIEAHADAIMELSYSLFGEKKPIVMGHSYGSTIALKIAMDYSQNIEGSVVASGAVDADHEIVFWISYLLKYPPLKRLMGPMLRVASDEKLAHREMIRTQLQNYQSISKPVVVIHGTEDSLVPFENARTMQKNIPQNYLIWRPVDGKDHPLQYTSSHVLVDGLFLIKDGINL